MDQTPLNRWYDPTAVSFTPAVSKEYHFMVAFVLLLIGRYSMIYRFQADRITQCTAFVLSGIFALSM